MRQSTIRRAEINVRSIWLVLATIMLASAFLAAAPSANSPQCDPIDRHKLLAADGAAQDEFGYSVAISGTRAIIGARYDRDNGTWSGSAYLFDSYTGQQLFKLLPDDGAAGDNLGLSVAISGTTAIVGAPYDDDNGVDSGSAYLFDTITGQQITKLLPGDGAAGNWFGYSVAIIGTTAIVGAPYDDDNGVDSGSAYLFDTITGQQITKLLPGDGAAGNWFGNSVAISGATAIVGANGDRYNGTYAGSAYLFDTTTGRQIAKLLPSDGAEFDRFGGSVAISGSTAIVGAGGDDDNGGNSGSAYLFDTTTGRQIAKLLASDGAERDWFGVSVSISGATAIVGAPYDNDSGTNSGSAYLFDTITGRQIAKLLPSDGAERDYFGKSVAISGTTAIAGAYWDDDNGLNSGSAYLFDINCHALAVSPDPLIAGQMGTFTGTNLRPSTLTYLAYSFAGLGSTNVPILNVTLDLASPTRVQGMKVADSSGNVTVNLHIPPSASGRNVWFQACQFELTTNVVATSVQ